ncbi:ABC transporter ATP-binding protein [Mycoplasma todarodis]|uniref:ABC transporter ATP-binding protein n=1 Tax=Mycoplasma todarodis TaxID=1937191 RepID=A0A4R0XX29_9MOLU|nr:ABC transporter ATP-binding protein [Mycoplasma todarodis]TCG11561.1 ABC transporter ATP-binding protein [Mycoplasma todarodis]
MGQNTPALEVKKFTKKYKGAKKAAVSGASFNVYPGEFHGFIGANGSGKTTTIKSLIGAYAKFQGDIKIFGLDHLSEEAKSKVGYIPEAAKFPKGYSTYKYIVYMSYLSGLSMRESKDFANNVLKEIGLEKLKNRNPNTFSSGQKKKVLLAQALVHNPEIIIMDEPAANLDPKARIDFFDTLKKLQEKGVAILISSHILTELDKYVNSLTIIDGGKVVFTGKLEEAIGDSDLEYMIQTTDNNALIKFLKKHKFNYSKTTNGCIVKLNKKIEAKQLMSLLASSRLVVNTFKNNQNTLEEVYKKYVSLGSVDDEVQEPSKGGKNV